MLFRSVADGRGPLVGDVDRADQPGQRRFVEPGDAPRGVARQALDQALEGLALAFEEGLLARLQRGRVGDGAPASVRPSRDGAAGVVIFEY